MAVSSRIQHYRAASSGAAPPSLLPGELAVDEFLEKLFYGFDPGGGGARAVRMLALSKLLRADVAQSLSAGEKVQAAANLGAEPAAWTPQLRFGGNSAGMAASTSGRIVQIGKLVFYQGVIALSAKGTSPGPATIVGLPAAQNSWVGLFGVEYYSGMAGITNLGGYIAAGASTITLTNKGASQHTGLVPANFTDTSQLYFAGQYVAA